MNANQLIQLSLSQITVRLWWKALHCHPRRWNLPVLFCGIILKRPNLMFCMNFISVWWETLNSVRYRYRQTLYVLPSSSPDPLFTLFALTPSVSIQGPAFTQRIITSFKLDFSYWASPASFLPPPCYLLCLPAVFNHLFSCFNCVTLAN